MKTRNEYAAMAERLADQAHHFSFGDGGDPAVGAALAAEALVYATLAAVAEPVPAEEPRIGKTAPARTPVALNSPAAWLARQLNQTRTGLVSVDQVDATTLTVDVAPESLDDWEWWLGRFNIPPGTATFRGSFATAKGSVGGVRVLLTGHGVGALYAAERDAGTGGSS